MRACWCGDEAPPAADSTSDSSGLGASPYGRRSASCSERPRSTAPSMSTSAGNGGSFGPPNEALLLPVSAGADDCDVTDVALLVGVPPVVPVVAALGPLPGSAGGDPPTSDKSNLPPTPVSAGGAEPPDRGPLPEAVSEKSKRSSVVGGFGVPSVDEPPERPSR